MPNRVHWDPRFSVGNETLDMQHKYLIDQCNVLADCLDEAGDAGERKFDQCFAAMDDLIAYLTDNCCQGGGQCLPKTAAASTTAKRRVKAAA